MGVPSQMQTPEQRRRHAEQKRAWKRAHKDEVNARRRELYAQERMPAPDDRTTTQAIRAKALRRGYYG